MAAFSDLGAACSVPTCGQQDFLPFTCDACSRVFCQDHFRYSDHQCEAAAAKSLERQVVLCPNCRAALPCSSSDPLEGHICPKATEPPAQQQRCAAKGCREVLYDHNKTKCWRCNQEHCIKHRFEEDHQCVSLDSAVATALGRARLVMTAEEFEIAHTTLQKVFGNILADPGNEKFRTLKKSNAIVCMKLRHPACVEALKLCGFTETADTFNCRPAADLSLMREMQGALKAYEPDAAPAPAAPAARAAAVAAATGGGGRAVATTRLVNGVIVREAAPAPAPAAAAAATPAAAASSLVAPAPQGRPGSPRGPAKGKTVYDFERRTDRGQQQQQQQQSLQDLRRLQKQRYQEGGAAPAGPTVPTGPAAAAASGYPPATPGAAGETFMAPGGGSSAAPALQMGGRGARGVQKKDECAVQ